MTPGMRLSCAAAAFVFAMLAAFLPTEWYHDLPRDPDLPERPFDGSSLLRLMFFLEALVLGSLGATGWIPAREARPVPVPTSSTADDLSPRAARLLLATVIVLAVALRGFRLGSDLWLDEIATVGTYASRPLSEVYATYLSPGNHLLNSLLLKISAALFGTSEWAVRLPAAAFGAATIPVMYAAARLAMSRAASLGAALLVAVSYHHIFFSQNARGYSAHLFAVLLSSALLADAIRRDRARTWVAYVLAMTVGLVALMTSAFTFGAHVIVGTIAVLGRRRAGVNPHPLAVRLLLAFAATAFLALQVYAIALPDVIAIYPSVYAVQGSGYALFSAEFVAEIVRGTSVGFAAGLAALPFIGAAVAGFIVLTRRNWVLSASITLTLVVTLVFLVLRGQSIAPRFLLPVLPLAILSCTAAIDALALFLARRGRLSLPGARIFALAFSSAIAAASLMALPSYYSAPKQPYRQAIRHIESQRRMHREVIVVYPATGAFRYYLPREGVRDTQGYHFVTSAAAYDSSLANVTGRRAVLVTTLFRVLQSESPAVATRITREWKEVRSFRGTLGGGSIVLWERLQTPATP